MEDINLHFTGDFSAIGLAHNLLSALIDDHIYHGNSLGFDVRRITWRRVVDMTGRCAISPLAWAARAMVIRGRMALTSWSRRRSWRSSAWSTICAT